MRSISEIWTEWEEADSKEAVYRKLSIEVLLDIRSCLLKDLSNQVEARTRHEPPKFPVYGRSVNE